MNEKKYLKWYNKVGYGSGDIGAVTEPQKAAWAALRDAYPGFNPRRA